MSVHVRATHTIESCRLTVVASRRVGNSPTRNRAKRLLREAAARISWPVGHDVVLVARPGIVGASMWDVHRDLVGLVDALLGAASDATAGAT